jgi:hypothetical protein
VTAIYSRITIPSDVAYSDLKMSRDPETGDVEFDWAPIKRICDASRIDIAVFLDGPEDNLAELLTLWYSRHLAAGGAPDGVQEDLIAEARLEGERGSFSHLPGRA